MSGNVEKVFRTIYYTFRVQIIRAIHLPGEIMGAIHLSSHHPRSMGPLSKVSIRDTPAEAKVFEAELQNCAVSWLAS